MLQYGRRLSALEYSYFLPYFSQKTLALAMIIEGHVPFWLLKNMCAVVLGVRIYFRAGVYNVQNIASLELLAHELTHVEQYLSGMTVFKYCWASRHGYQKNPYEIEAYANAKEIRRRLIESGKYPALSECN